MLFIYIIFKNKWTVKKSNWVLQVPKWISTNLVKSRNHIRHIFCPQENNLRNQQQKDKKQKSSHLEINLPFWIFTEEIKIKITFRNNNKNTTFKNSWQESDVRDDAAVGGSRTHLPGQQLYWQKLCEGAVVELWSLKACSFQGKAWLVVIHFHPSLLAAHPPALGRQPCPRS